MDNGKDRFERVYIQQHLTSAMEVWADKVTGVCYLFHAWGSAGGMTPLLNRDGTPVVLREYSTE